ncbi:hypothetical protein EVAR_42912_1 [Eumeta japonica]|uniref:Uncharacterized protein n=1 Tax=Eumeta variegata TaxID=151549 RepID=A0A4C1WVQ6_EUMVA|nr:hypothetical protein EVAR_42912_1 [Eumeta japonica]
MSSGGTVVRGVALGREDAWFDPDHGQIARQVPNITRPKSPRPCLEEHVKPPSQWSGADGFRARIIHDRLWILATPEVTSVWSASWKGRGYLIDGDRVDGRGMGSASSELSLTGRNETAEVATSHPYAVWVWYFTSEPGHFRAGHGTALVQ